MLRKISIGIDCRDDAERDRVQEIANQLTGMQPLTGAQIISMFPVFLQHRGKMSAVFNFITRNGIPGPFKKMMGL